VQLARLYPGAIAGYVARNRAASSDSSQRSAVEAVCEHLPSDLEDGCRLPEREVPTMPWQYQTLRLDLVLIHDPPPKELSIDKCPMATILICRISGARFSLMQPSPRLGAASTSTSGSGQRRPQGNQPCRTLLRLTQRLITGTSH
jgi:hypothetical protein